MQTIKIRNLDSTEDNTITDNSYLALALNENDVKRGSEDPNDLNPRITVKTTISQLRKAILPTIGSSPPVSENEEGGIDVGIGEVILDENGDALVPQPPVVIKQGGKEQIKITDDGISLKENVIIDKTLSVTGPTTFNNTTTFNRDVFFNELTNDPSPAEGKIYRKSDGLYFNGSKLLTEGEGGKWVDGDSSGDIVYNGGNVGIGTSNPARLLHLKNNNSAIAFETPIDSNGSAFAQIKSARDGNSGFSSTLEFATTESATAVPTFGGNGTGGSGFVTRMLIDSAGNVGIGTTNPEAPLDFGNVSGQKILLWKSNLVNDTIKIRYGLGVEDLDLQIFTEERAKMSFGHMARSDGETFSPDMTIDSAGKVTIGASLGVGITPQEKFHVNGTVMLNDTPAPTTKTNKLYNVGGVLFWAGSRILTGSGGGTGSGGIAIADISGLQSALDNKLDKPAANSEPTFVDSDINLKTNISPIQSPIKSLESIRGVNFEWKEESNKSGEDQGLIAQEVEKIIPSAVKKGEDGYLKVDYTKLVPFLLEAVKDLSERVKELEKD